MILQPSALRFFPISLIIPPSIRISESLSTELFSSSVTMHLHLSRVFMFHPSSDRIIARAHVFKDFCFMIVFLNVSYFVYEKIVDIYINMKLNPQWRACI